MAATTAHHPDHDGHSDNGHGYHHDDGHGGDDHCIVFDVHGVMFGFMFWQLGCYYERIVLCKYGILLVFLWHFFALLPMV